MPWRLSSEVLRERWGIRGQGGRQFLVQFAEVGPQPAALGVGHRPGVDLHVQDVRRHIELDR